jgi:hypothetical protein
MFYESNEKIINFWHVFNIGIGFRVYDELIVQNSLGTSWIQWIIHKT